MKYIILLLIIFITVIYFSLNKIFVYFLRSDKGESIDKSPNDIEEVKSRLKIIKDSKYISKYEKSNYDLYIPKKANNLPIIIWLHGGAFISGDKIGTRNFGPLIADKGYAFFSINYEWAPEKYFPSQIEQLDNFIKYLREDLSKELPIDISKIILGGDSAGANIVASYAAVCRNSILSERVNLRTEIKDELKGLLLFCGPLDLRLDPRKIKDRKLKLFMKQIGWAYCGKRYWWKTELPDLASPIVWVNENYPSTYITDGNVYSFEVQGKMMVDKLEKEKVLVKSRFFKGKEIPHEFQFDYKKYPKESKEVFNDCIDFLREVIK